MVKKQAQVEAFLLRRMNGVNAHQGVGLSNLRPAIHFAFNFASIPFIRRYLPSIVRRDISIKYRSCEFVHLAKFKKQSVSFPFFPPAYVGQLFL